MHDVKIRYWATTVDIDVKTLHNMVNYYIGDQSYEQGCIPFILCLRVCHVFFGVPIAFDERGYRKKHEQPEHALSNEEHWEVSSINKGP